MQSLICIPQTCGRHWLSTIIIERFRKHFRTPFAKCVSYMWLSNKKIEAKPKKSEISEHKSERIESKRREKLI